MASTMLDRKFILFVCFYSYVVNNHAQASGLSLNAVTVAPDIVLVTLDVLENTTVDKLRVFYRDSKSIEWNTMEDFDQKKRYGIVTGLKPNTHYYFLAKGNVNLRRRQTITHTVTPSLERTVPSNVTVTTKSNGNVLVTWNNPDSDQFNRYFVQIQKITRSYDTIQFKQVNVVQENKATFKNLLPNQSYEVQVVPLNNQYWNFHIPTYKFYLASSHLDTNMNKPIFPDGDQEIINVSKYVDVAVTCAANGVPMPTVQWFQKDTPVTQRKIGRLDYVIRHITVTTQPQCRAVNSLGLTIKKVFVVVPADPDGSREPFILDHLPEAVEVVRGEEVSLTCQAWGEPIPRLQWYKNSRAAPGVRRGDGVMVYRDNKVMGSYTMRCRAWNRHGYEIRAVQIIVKDRPRVAATSTTTSTTTSRPTPTTDGSSHGTTFVVRVKSEMKAPRLMVIKWIVDQGPLKDIGHFNVTVYHKGQYVINKLIRSKHRSLNLKSVIPGDRYMVVVDTYNTNNSLVASSSTAPVSSTYTESKIQSLRLELTEIRDTSFKYELIPSGLESNSYNYRIVIDEISQVYQTRNWFNQSINDPPTLTSFETMRPRHKFHILVELLSKVGNPILNISHVFETANRGGYRPAIVIEKIVTPVPSTTTAVFINTETPSTTASFTSASTTASTKSSTLDMTSSKLDTISSKLYTTTSKLDKTISPLGATSSALSTTSLTSIKIRLKSSTLGTTSSTLGTTSSTLRTTSSVLGTTSSILGTTSSTLGTTSPTLGWTSSTSGSTSSTLCSTSSLLCSTSSTFNTAAVTEKTTAQSNIQKPDETIIAATNVVSLADETITAATNVVSLADETITAATNVVSLADETITAATNVVSLADETITAATNVVSLADETITAATNVVSLADETITAATNVVSLADETITAATNVVSLADEIITAATNVVSLADETITAATNVVSLADETITAATNVVSLADETITAATNVVSLAPSASSRLLDYLLIFNLYQRSPNTQDYIVKWSFKENIKFAYDVFLLKVRQDSPTCDLIIGEVLHRGREHCDMEGIFNEGKLYYLEFEAFGILDIPHLRVNMTLMTTANFSLLTVATSDFLKHSDSTILSKELQLHLYFILFPLDIIVMVWKLQDEGKQNLIQKFKILVQKVDSANEVMMDTVVTSDLRMYTIKKFKEKGEYFFTVIAYDANDDILTFGYTYIKSEVIMKGDLEPEVTTNSTNKDEPMELNLSLDSSFYQVLLLSWKVTNVDALNPIKKFQIKVHKINGNDDVVLDTFVSGDFRNYAMKQLVGKYVFYLVAYDGEDNILTSHHVVYETPIREKIIPVPTTTSPPENKEPIRLDLSVQTDPSNKSVLIWNVINENQEDPINNFLILIYGKNFFTHVNLDGHVSKYSLDRLELNRFYVFKVTAMNASRTFLISNSLFSEVPLREKITSQYEQSASSTLVKAL